VVINCSFRQLLDFRLVASNFVLEIANLILVVYPQSLLLLDLFLSPLHFSLNFSQFLLHLFYLNSQLDYHTILLLNLPLQLSIVSCQLLTSIF
jgi:hypothetical protein